MNHDAEESIREAIYAMAWREGVSRVAEEYHVSTTALRRLSKRYQIPIPPAGFWSMGPKRRQSARKPLRPLDRAKWSGYYWGNLVKDLAEEQAKNRAEQRVQLLGDVSQFDALTSVHPLISKTGKKLRQRSGWGDPKGLRSAPGEVVDLEVTHGALDRALDLANRLVFAFEAVGGVVSVDREKKRTIVDVDGVVLPMSITEKVARFPHEPTRSERRAQERYFAQPYWSRSGEYPSIPQYDYTPTGELTVSFGWGRNFNDTAKTSLENRLREIVLGALAQLEIKRDEEEMKARQQARFDEARRRYVEQAERRQAEEVRYGALQKDVRDWREAEEIRAFIRAVESNGISPDPACGLEEWLAWASAKADWIDPMIQVCDTVLDAPALKEPRLHEFG
ncbi:hypothetical protein [Guyparkeria sp.]|uniref:hypothetical protein n=1 Tax=Guyparkeria sp. TaxID=2035736 RepID=UPI0039708A23